MYLRDVGGSHEDCGRLGRESSVQEGSWWICKLGAVKGSEAKVWAMCELNGCGEYEQLCMEAVASRLSFR